MAKKESDKFLLGNIFEGMTSISALLNSPDSAFNDRTITNIFIDNAKKKQKAREIAYLEHQSKKHGFPITYVTAEEIDAITTGNTHGGIIAKCTDRTLLQFDMLERNISANGFYVLLDGIEDPYNFGYTVRSLYAAGVSGIILAERNWMGASGLVARASAGCSEKLPMFVGDFEKAISIFRTYGYKIVAAGIRDSVSLFDAELTLPLLLMVGGEKRGINRALLDLSDLTVRIEYCGTSGFGGSLSAASAATVIAFEVLRQNRDPNLTRITNS